MMIGINTSPLAGLDGKLLTARQVRNRLDQELVGNVSLRVLDSDRPDAWEVQGRGELQLAVLVEQMRREGFELTIGKPQVVTRRIDGVLSEPVERLAIDVPEEYSGVVIGLLALRKGKMEQMVNHGTGWVRLDYLVPARGLIGFRTEFITETRGTGILHHVFEGFAPWFGELKTRPNGSLVADRRGVSTSHALMSLQERGELFIGPAVDVYEGMVIGVNARPEDLDVNACQGEEGEQHALGPRRGARPPRAAAPALARAGAGVHPRRRGRRGHAVARAAAQGRAARRRPHEDRARARRRRARRRVAPRDCVVTSGSDPDRVARYAVAQHERVARRVARERPVRVLLDVRPLAIALDQRGRARPRPAARSRSAAAPRSPGAGGGAPPLRQVLAPTWWW